jgi:archaellum component FlaG (FlaF/FlaG flagellin family)
VTLDVAIPLFTLGGYILGKNIHFLNERYKIVTSSTQAPQNTTLQVSNMGTAHSKSIHEVLIKGRIKHNVNIHQCKSPD